MIPYIITENSINLSLQGKMYVCNKTHVNFEGLKNAIKNNANEDELLLLVNPKSTIEKYSNGKILIKDDILFYDDRELNNCFTRRIITMLKEGYNIQPLILFLNNLMDNPSARSVNEFYGFLERNRLPLTDDGHFLAYKKVRENYLDIHSGTISNAIGEVVEMPRNFVDDIKERTCSFGLHFASFDYMPHYGSSDIDDRIVIVKINPRDVVSFPDDYNGAKGRCCRYEVVNEIDNDAKTQIKDYFIQGKDYEKVLKVLKGVKELVRKDFEKEVKYTSNFASLELNNKQIRDILDNVRLVFNIDSRAEFKYETLESITVDSLVNWIVSET